MLQQQPANCNLLQSASNQSSASGGGWRRPDQKWEGEEQGVQGVPRGCAVGPGPPPSHQLQQQDLSCQGVHRVLE